MLTLLYYAISMYCIFINSEHFQGTFDEKEVVCGGISFSFGKIFGPTISQAELFNATARRLLEFLFLGQDVCLLAYGQTGSGKTYTMGTRWVQIFTFETSNK